MYDIITFGSATRDIFVKSKKFKIINQKDFTTGEGFCLPLGTKFDVEEIFLATGGGGTNTAATFANQGFSVAFFGVVGQDSAGQDVVDELESRGIDTSLVLRTDKKVTNHSIVISSDGKERTILVYRGASSELKEREIPFNKLQAKWFYLAPLSGKLCDLTETIVDFAIKNGIKVALNPGNCQLTLPKKVLKNIFNKIDVLLLNQEEASLLTGIHYHQEREIFKKIDDICPGIAIMTKGKKGAVVSDGNYLYKAKPEKSKVVDRTGAGDAFGSGFVSGFIQSNGNIEYATQIAIANATSCLRQWGAKNGLLKKGETWQKVKVQKKKLIIK
jgi:ribokinase